MAKKGGKPHHSKLNPYIHEIAQMRRQRPPVPYTEIARILNERHPGLDVSHNAVWAFVASRSKGKKVLYMTLQGETPITPVTTQKATEAQPPSDTLGQIRKELKRRKEEQKPLQIYQDDE